MVNLLTERIYIWLLPVLIYIYSVIYCVIAEKSFLIPICTVFLFLLFLLKYWDFDIRNWIKFGYVCFCIHVAENDLYQIFSNTHNKYIFIVCTLFMLVIYRQPSELMGKKKLWSRSVIDIIVTAQCFAYGCFVIAKYRDVKLAICLFALLLCWSHMLISVILKLFFQLNKCISKEERQAEELRQRYVWIILFGIIFGTGLLFSVLYYPGIITPDNIYFYESSLNDSLFGASDIHSFAYLCVFKTIILVFHSYYAVTFIMVLIFSIVWASIFSYLCKKGLKRSAAIVITVLWVLFPSNVHMLIASWKDVPFTICILWLSFQLIKYCFDDNYHNTFGNLAALTLSLFGTAVFRSNGQVVLLVMVVVSAIKFICHKIKVQVLCSVLAALVLLMIFKGPIFAFFNVEQSPSNYSALPFMDGIVEYIYQGNELDSETEEYVYSLTNYDECMNHYTPYNLDIGMFEGGYSNFELDKAVKGYLRCLLRSPLSMVSARFKRTFNMWAIFYHDDFPINKFLYSDVWENNYGWKYDERTKFLRELLSSLYSESHLLGAIQSIVYRGGFNILLWICSILYLGKNNKKYICVLIPIAANTFGLFLGCCFPDYRYIYPMFVVTVPYVCAILTANLNTSRV